MPPSIFFELDNQEASENRRPPAKRSRISSDTSTASSVDETQEDLPSLPEGRGTVRRIPARRSLRDPFVTSVCVDARYTQVDGKEKSLVPSEANPSRTDPDPPPTPVTPRRQLRDIHAALLTPPTTPQTSIDNCPFPIQPIPIIIGNKSSDRQARRRCVSAGDLPLTPPTTPDRFVSTRTASHDVAKAFHVGKPTQQLSSAERLLRQNSDNPDPFRSPSIARQGRPRVSSGQPNRNLSGHIRVISSTNLLQVQTDPLNPPIRQISTGAVWNVGGAAATAPSGPMNGIPDGRGGLLGSGTNAPMYTSRFFEGNTPDQDRGRLEGRLAAALDIDQASRVLNYSQSPDRSRGTKLVVGGSPSRSKQVEQRTSWKDGQWVRGGSLPRESSSP